MVPCSHRQGSSARLGWGGQRKPLALGTGNTVLDLMCVLFVVVLLNDFMVTTAQPMGTGATVGVLLPPAEGACAPLSRSQRADKWLLCQEALQALCGTCWGLTWDTAHVGNLQPKLCRAQARFLFCTLYQQAQVQG